MLRTVLWLYYRPFPSATYENAPFLTVIIPAYNEGSMVKNAIYSVLEADYPRDRLELFVVDDGSTDDTWRYIQEAASRYPHAITPVRFAKNRGKRAGLDEGFRRARGEIVITVDSDSVVEPESLLAMAGPFVDPRIGAVAGKVVVYNRAQGLIPRMLQVRYVLSFDFLRAVQSTYGTVYCCPGALTAYRTAVVRQVLDAMDGPDLPGDPCTFGEDRAMTNFILSAGYDTVFQRTGRVQTIVPWNYRKLCKMYLRWDRTYVRESHPFHADRLEAFPLGHGRFPHRRGDHEPQVSHRVGKPGAPRRTSHPRPDGRDSLLLRHGAPFDTQHVLLLVYGALLALPLRHHLFILLLFRAPVGFSLCPHDVEGKDLGYAIG